MFTGIVEAVATLEENSGSSLRIARPKFFTDLHIGSSIAVSGVCLSIIAFDESSMNFDVVPETLKRTKLGSLQKGDKVNLERALPASGRFDGHIVQGHVDGKGAVVEVTQKDNDVLFTVSIPSELKGLIVEKGSVTLDGVSLTVGSFKDHLCTVALVPHTLAHTTLGVLQKGDVVHIETDILGKYIQSLHA